MASNFLAFKINLYILDTYMFNGGGLYRVAGWCEPPHQGVGKDCSNQALPFRG